MPRQFVARSIQPYALPNSPLNSDPARIVFPLSLSFPLPRLRSYASVQAGPVSFTR